MWAMSKINSIENFSLYDQNSGATIYLIPYQINQMDNFIQLMYRRLQQYEPLPDLKGDEDKPSRSEANWIYDTSI